MGKSIMIQGTMSNVGKSILTGGLCRIFVQDGYKVAPFKSQNMALNSFITKEGLEMGRAQVMQAEAAKIEPSVIMNPILLKPTNDTGSQVIVNGEVIGTMTAREYFACKKDFIPDILSAYHKLEAQNDIIVIEGAGSPAEINLKSEDIVNMGMAKMANSPVLLVGDIDRGGVFAQLLGTIELLEQEERKMVKGLVINKFRGDKTILDPGLRMIEEKIGIPVSGVIPYCHLDIDDEDSLSERFSKKTSTGLIDIAVIRLPRISNFTDFNPFEYMEEVSLRYVASSQELKDPDMIIIPGTKSTIDDLLWLRESGLEAKILQQASKGKIIFGVCGGYQMLGEVIIDSDSVEIKDRAKARVKGLGLLPDETIFMPEKTRTRVKGVFKNLEGVLSGLNMVEFEGYEIHMGITKSKSGYCNLLVDEIDNTCKKQDGSCNGNVYGTYVHGIFDQEEVVSRIVNILLKLKGYDCSSVRSVNITEYKERQYDLLADAIRENIDMEQVYSIIKKGL